MQVQDRLEALLRILLERMLEDAPQLTRQLAPDLGHLRRCVLHDRRQQRDSAVAAERTPAGDHLVQGDAEGENVGPMIERRSLRLLGRHVGDGSENDADFCNQPGLCCRHRLGFAASALVASASRRWRSAEVACSKTSE